MEEEKIEQTEEQPNENSNENSNSGTAYVTNNQNGMGNIVSPQP